jgi:hypothetical protein
MSAPIIELLLGLSLTFFLLRAAERLTNRRPAPVSARPRLTHRGRP